MEKNNERQSRLPQEVTYEEMVELLEVTPKMNHKVGFMLGVESGLRISEVCKLQKRDIDVERGTVYVREGKGKKDRIAPLPSDWQPHLINYIPLGCGVRSLQEAFNKYAIKSGLKARKPEVVFHSTRHGFCTHGLKSGIKIEKMQMLMGHTDPGTTARYNRMAPDEAVNEMKDTFI